MTQPAPRIPAPVPQPESDFYWEKCKENELWLRHCKACDQAYFYPRDICQLFQLRRPDLQRLEPRMTYVHQLSQRHPIFFLNGLYSSQRQRAHLIEDSLL